MSDVDSLVEQTPLELVIKHYGLPLPDGQSREYRMNCVFNETCRENKYGDLAVQQHAAKRIYCHSCKTAGNLLTLLHGLENGSPPSSGRLRGSEFKASVAKLREINGEVEASNETATQKRETNSEPPAPDTKPSFNVNLPLHRHDKEAARALADLYKDLVTDVSEMSPEAAAYVRKREEWLTPELMKKWGCGWIPGNGRSLFRKNYFVYTHRNTRGDVVSYSGRDLSFESKWERWVKAGMPEGKKPSKHRYVSGFKRGAELYGGFADRLNEPQLKESLEAYGLVVVEGMNDVIRLDELGICAVGLCSNRATEQQMDMLMRFAKQVAGGRLLLAPDQDDEGKDGFKDLLWRLSSDGQHASVLRLPQPAKQPEELHDKSAFREIRTSDANRFHSSL